MRSISWKYRPLALAACLAGLLVPATSPAQAQNAAAAARPARAAAAAPAPSESEVQARTLLTGMATFLSKAPLASVVMRGTYDVVQRSGEKLEFGETRRITLSRPDNRLRVEGERSDGSQVLTVFDGKAVTLIDRGSNVYATAPQTGGLDESIIHFVRDLGVQMPLAALLLSSAPEELNARVRSIDYVEKTSLYGAPAHHLAGRTDTVDVQIWIADGATPVPQRVVLTYRTEPGVPQFRAQLSDWNFAPAISDATFAAPVPEGGQKVSFVGQLQRVTPATRAGKAKGGK
jgi:hypothetical protein